MATPFKTALPVLALWIGSAGLSGAAPAAPVQNAQQLRAAITAPTASPRNEWEFEVLLDDKPIGSHRFTLEQSRPQVSTANATSTSTSTPTPAPLHVGVRSIAAFDVKVFGLTVYRYRYDASEEWVGGCLAALQSETSNGGGSETVDAKRSASGGLRVEADGKSGVMEQTLKGCLMSFAYWDPAILRQTQLLNGESGKLNDVKIEALSDGNVQVGNSTVLARRFRLEGGEHPLVLSYSPQGEWLALEATVVGGKSLRYHLLQ